MSKSNSKRFVRAAWSLLFFQVIASAGAVAVTGYVMLNAQDHGPSAVAPVDTAVATTVTTDASTTAATPAPAPPPLTAAVAPCPHDGGEVYVNANVEWCDTGINVTAGQTIQVHERGAWSDDGAATFDGGGHGSGVGGTLVGDAPLGALVGRIDTTQIVIGKQTSLVSIATGRLYLAMNDVRGQYADNQGQLTVFIEVR